MHGELFPRFIDYMTDEYCDTFASDEHLCVEWQSESWICGPLSVMEERFPTIADFAREVASHLVKTQINKGRTVHDCYCSSFLSFTGDLRNEVPKSLSIDDYIRRVRLFLLVMLDGMPPDIDEVRFIDHLIENLDDPLSWGYACSCRGALDLWCGMIIALPLEFRCVDLWRNHY